MSAAEVIIMVSRANHFEPRAAMVAQVVAGRKA